MNAQNTNERNICVTIFTFCSYGLFRIWRLSGYNVSRERVGEKPEHRTSEKFALQSRRYFVDAVAGKECNRCLTNGNAFRKN
jgi:hypothetical protein